VDARAAAPQRGMTGWLDPLERALDAAPRPVAFFFRDDDAGWDDGALVALLDLFARHDVPLDLAVIPAALGSALARELRSRARTGLVACHQHGFAHANHEPSGRPCEFGPSRSAAAQRRDLARGAHILREHLGESLAPIFTPPWNRCTAATAACLPTLGFRALSRDATAEPLEVDGLQELRVGVDWLGKRKGVRLRRSEIGERLAALAGTGEPVGVMLHHAAMDARERRGVAELLALVAAHPRAACVPMSSLLGVSSRAAAGPARASLAAAAGRASPRT
jgi:predicted deacetylase